jgi:hypothetical protein
MVVVVCVRLILQRNSWGWGIYAVRVGLWWFPYELLGDGDGDDLRTSEIEDQVKPGRPWPWNNLPTSQKQRTLHKDDEPNVVVCPIRKSAFLLKHIVIHCLDHHVCLLLLLKNLSMFGALPFGAVY